MIKLTLTNQEKKRLLNYAENNIEKGHWGDATIEIPEEKALYYKIHESFDEIELSFPQVELLVNWFSESTNYGLMLLPEDTSIMNQINYRLYQYYDAQKNVYLNELNKIANIIIASAKYLSKNEFESQITHFKELERIERDKEFNKLRDMILQNNETIENQIVHQDEIISNEIHPNQHEKIGNNNPPKKKVFFKTFVLNTMDDVRSLFKDKKQPFIDNNSVAVDKSKLIKKAESFAKKLSKSKHRQ